MQDGPTGDAVEQNGDHAAAASKAEPMAGTGQPVFKIKSMMTKSIVLDTETTGMAKHQVAVPEGYTYTPLSEVSCLRACGVSVVSFQLSGQRE